MKPVPANQPIAFLSDIHGNLRALDAVAAELSQRMITSIYVAGDLLLGGDDPVGVFKRLQQLDAKCVGGLSDRALSQIDPATLRPTDADQVERAADFLRTRDAIGELARLFLERLPERIRIPLVDGTEILLVHGSPKDHSIEMSHHMSDDELLALIDDDPADLVVCGASHVPFTRAIEGVRVVNAGSVGAAPEGNVAHYTVVTPRMEGSMVEQTLVEYD